MRLTACSSRQLSLEIRNSAPCKAVSRGDADVVIFSTRKCLRRRCRGKASSQEAGHRWQSL
jgi:hypothetical protein